MKTTNLKFLITCMLTCVALAGSSMSFPKKPSKPPKPGHHNAPFDGGISLLVAAGVAYGVKKAYKAKKQDSIK